MENNKMEFSNITDRDNYSSFLQLSDAKLLTDDGCTFDIHKVMLVKESAYFYNLFCVIDKGNTEYRISGISGNCLDAILCYIYTGIISVTEKNINDLMKAAKYFSLNDIDIKVKQNLKHIINIGNCVKIYTTAQNINSEQIVDECFSFIQMNFEYVTDRRIEGIQELPLESLMKILSNRSLNVRSERTIWRAIINWTEKERRFRLHYVPHLLTCLSRKEVDEKLARDILQHEIVVDNPSMQHLNEMKCTNNLTSNLDVLLNFLHVCSNNIMELFDYRIPKSLYIILLTNRNMKQAGDYGHNLYITYDEDISVWRKVGVIDFHPDFMIAVGRNLYLFETVFRICMKYDICSQEWLRMASFRRCSYNASIVEIDGYIYVLAELNISPNIWTVQVYDTTNDTWFEGVHLQNMCNGLAVTIDKKIYVVGSPDYKSISTHVFDTTEQKWSVLPPPSIYRSRFALVAYDQKIYLIGGFTNENYTSSVEVFDPKLNHWGKLPDVPYAYTWADAIVLNHRIFVYDHINEDGKTKTACWDDTKGFWEKLEDENPLRNFDLRKFCSVDNEETLRVITKQNRGQDVQFEKSIFEKL